MSIHYILPAMIVALITVSPLILAVNLFYRRVTTFGVHRSAQHTKIMAGFGIVVLCLMIYLSWADYQAGTSFWNNFFHHRDGAAGRPDRLIEPYYRLIEFLSIPSQYLSDAFYDAMGWDFEEYDSVPPTIFLYLPAYLFWTSPFVIFLIGCWRASALSGIESESILLLLADALILFIAIASIMLMIIPMLTSMALFVFAIGIGIIALGGVFWGLSGNKRR